MKALYAVAFACLIGTMCVLAQEALPAKLINVGLINGRAISLPKPEYPEAAKQARIGGIVGVNVVVDESGAVIEAVAEANDQHERRDADGVKLEPVTLDPTLREAAENAARLARFTPTLRGGRAVKVKGKILYNFVADNSDKPPRVGDIYGPLLSGKAVSMPQPVYPEDARAASVSGSVTVQISVDELGNVISATAVNGHPLLRAAAEEAAMRAKFSPTTIAGQPVTVAGILTYTFATTRKKIE